MSWFGLFHMVFGLGAIAKDSIQESIADTQQREAAERRGADVYYVNGYKCRSTKTGRDAYVDSGLTKYDHTYIRDRKTRQIIEDVTVRDNARNQKEEKQKAKENGSIFYRTTEFDTSKIYKSGVYVSDKIPGYFRREQKEINNRFVWIFTQGELELAPESYKCIYIVRTKFWEDGQKTYFEDGSVYRECYLEENGKHGANYYKKGEHFE